MRNKRRVLPTEIYFVTTRTVEQRFLLDPYACPDAWLLAEGRGLDSDEKHQMRERGRQCVDRMQSLVDAILEAEKNPAKSRPSVTLDMYTESMPNIIGSCIARGIEMFGIELYGLVAMSNHTHMLVRAPAGNLPDFMAYVNGQIASNANRFLGRRCAFWERRYAAAPVLDNDAELERLGYLLANPQNAGIADSIAQWPGLSSATFFLEHRKQRFLAFDRTAWHEANCPQNIAPYLSTKELEHKLLPQLKKLGKKKLRRKIRRLIKNHVRAQPVLDSNVDRNLESSVRRQLLRRAVIPTERPESARKPPRRYSSPQPLCHTTNSRLRELYKQWHRAFLVAYETCAIAYRNGDTEVIFPPGSFAPSRYPQAKYPIDPDVNTILHPTRKNLEAAAAL